jgi:hypothetical protein
MILSKTYMFPIARVATKNNVGIAKPNIIEI